MPLPNPAKTKWIDYGMPLTEPNAAEWKPFIPCVRPSNVVHLNLTSATVNDERLIPTSSAILSLTPILEQIRHHRQYSTYSTIQ